MRYGVVRYKPEWHLQNHVFSITWQHWTANSMGGEKDHRVWGILSITVSRSPVPKQRVYILSSVQTPSGRTMPVQCFNVSKEKEFHFFFKKEGNPPNTHQIRPIEGMWVIIKQQVYTGGSTTASEQQLISETNSTIRSLVTEVPRRMMRDLPQHVRRTDQRDILPDVH